MSQEVSQQLDDAINAGFAAEPDDIGGAPPPPPEPTPAPEPTSEPAVPDEQAPDAPTAPDSSLRTDPAPSAQPSYSKDYNDWLDRFGGPTRDPNVAARAAWDMNNRLAQQARPEPTAPPAPASPPPAPTVPPELERFDGDLRTMETQFNQITQQEASYRKEHARISGEVSRLTRNLAADRIPLEAEPDAKRKLAELTEQLDTYEAWLQRFEQDKLALDRDWRVTKALREQAEAVVQLRTREAAIEERNKQARLESFGQAFFGGLPVIAKEGVPIADGRQMERFVKHVKREALIRLGGAETDLNTVDLPAFFREMKTEFLADEDEIRKAASTSYTKGKVADANVAAPDGRRAVAPVVKQGKFSSQAEVDAFIDSAFER